MAPLACLLAFLQTQSQLKSVSCIFSLPCRNRGLEQLAVRAEVLTIVICRQHQGVAALEDVELALGDQTELVVVGVDARPGCVHRAGRDATLDLGPGLELDLHQSRRRLSPAVA